MHKLDRFESDGPLSEADRQLLSFLPAYWQELFSTQGLLGIAGTRYALGPFAEMTADCDKYLRGRGLIIGYDDTEIYAVYLFSGEVVEVNFIQGGYNLDKPLKRWESLDDFVDGKLKELESD